MIGLDLNPTVGALEIGITTSVFLFGITTAQACIYYQKFPNDPLKTRTLVGFVWLLELAHVISVSHGLYVLTVTHYGEPASLIRGTRSLDTCLFFSSTIAMLVQYFFARRVWIVTQKRLVPMICFTLTTLRFIGGMVLAAEAFHMVTLFEYEQQWEWLITFILVVGACVDVMIALSLCANLIEQRRFVSARTVRLIDQLVLWSIQTGLITSVTAVAMAVCFLTMKENLIWLGVYMFLSRLFSNTLLASLNARSVLRRMHGSEIDPSAGPMTEPSGNGSNTIIQFKATNITFESQDHPCTVQGQMCLEANNQNRE